MEANSSPTHKPVAQAISGIEAGTPTIVTHGGNFHADDLWASALVREFFPGYAHCAVVRTRDKKILEAAKADPAFLVLDVGGQYVPSMGLYDHHFSPEPLGGDGEKIATAGMIWEQVYVPPHMSLVNVGVLQTIAENIDKTDTGTKVDGWSFSMTIHKCNPLPPCDSGEFDRRFDYLLGVMQDAIWGILWANLGCAGWEGVVEAVENHPQIMAWVAEYDRAQEASEKRVREAFSQEGALIVLDQYEPALMAIAHEAPENKIYSVFPSPEGSWMIQQIPVRANSFRGRKGLPAAWASLREKELDAVTGLEGCVFVHPGRFIGGHRTLDGAIAMAELATAIEE